MRRSSPLLDGRNERGQPRATVLVEIDSEGVLVQRARSRAAIAQEALELPALPDVLDPDQQLPHVAPVPSLLLALRAATCPAPRRHPYGARPRLPPSCSNPSAPAARP